MSWYRQVKSLFTISLIIFSYIIWSVLSYIVFSNKVNFNIMISFLCTTILMQYLNFKTENKLISIIIPSALAIPILFFSYRGNGLILNLIFNIIVLIFLYKIEEDLVDYLMAKEMVKKCILILIVIGAIGLISGFNLTKSSFRFYLMYIIAALIFLREIRKYSYNIMNKKSIIVNILISVGIFLLSSDGIFNIFIKLISNVKHGFDFLVEKLIWGMVYVLEKPMMFFIEKLKSLRSPIVGKILKASKTKAKTKTKTIIHNNQSTSIPEWMFILIKILFAIFIVWVVFKIIRNISSLMSKNNENALVISEEKEKIESKKGKKKFTKKIVNMFRNQTAKEKILNIYRQFQIRTKEKDIFRYYMTASQLKNATKVNINTKEDVNKDLESLTNIYNETKFSVHEINSSKEKIARYNVKTIISMLRNNNKYKKTK
ncbi:hypothetical protein ACFIJ5_02460 [Haloimpatiens sp. FM7330]|uniref:hypothetical protein n=1 Tax=Haloimpatiens sp. FM7330 TaxID=3298610 RepID=UPI00362A7494